MATQLNNGMCRCCASEGTFKDVKNTYQWMGEEEIYSEMLRECFDIALSIAEDDGGICEVCITQLRNASNFKKQVLHTEEHFKKRLEDRTFKTDIVKVEISREDDNDSDNDHDNDNENDNASDFSEYEVPIKQEAKEEEPPKPKKRAAKASPKPAKKAKAEDGETSTKRVRKRVNCNRSIISDSDGNQKEDSGLDESLQDRQSDSDPDFVEKPTLSITDIVREKLNTSKHFNNLKEILLCSNATLLGKCVDGVYKCSFCMEGFVKPADLKQHTMDHKDWLKEKFAVKKDSYLKCVNIDITGLLCKICHYYLDSLKELVLHLKNVHGKNMCPDSMTHILPYKFDTTELRCIVCTVQFYSYLKLRVHMKEHYKNYHCEQCGIYFVAPSQYQHHNLLKHKPGSFKCEHCPSIFENRFDKTEHLKSHKTNERRKTKSERKYRCGVCPEVFGLKSLKLKHFREVHGVLRDRVKCYACDRTFSSAGSLKAHVNVVHLLQRPAKCKLCDKCFKSEGTMKRHIKLTHSQERPFQCDICKKFYHSKSAVEVHIRIHLNDKRFKCELCDKAFVQKAGLQGHMRANHW